MRIKPHCIRCGRKLGVTFYYKKKQDLLKAVKTTTEAQKCYLEDDEGNKNYLYDWTKINNRTLVLEAFCLYCGGTLFQNLPQWKGKGIPTAI